MSAKEYPSRFYAIYVTGTMEEKIALIIASRAQYMDLDIRSIVVPVDLKGYIVLEVGNPAHLYDAIKGVRHIKRRRPLHMKKEDVLKLAAPVVEIPEISPGQVVRIIAGPFRGMRGRVVSVSESRGEVDLVLLESDIDMIVTVPIEQVKPEEAQ
ncbi:MAG: transcription elongation factor Spt5 [Desulfurococcales archaeon]|nr:transcription elongation factor Spt5 [Desulfurococcales archaeon]